MYTAEKGSLHIVGEGEALYNKGILRNESKKIPELRIGMQVKHNMKFAMAQNRFSVLRLFYFRQDSAWG